MISVEHGALASLVALTVVVGFVRLWTEVRSELAHADDGVLVAGRRAARGPAAAGGARVPRQGSASTWS